MEIVGSKAQARPTDRRVERGVLPVTIVKYTRDGHLDRVTFECQVRKQDRMIETSKR